MRKLKSRWPHGLEDSLVGAFAKRPGGHPHYVAEHFPTKVAETLDEIVQRVELLKTVPRMGKVYSKSDIPETRTIVCGKYRIFYCLRDTDQTVEVVTVWHHARQEPELP